jgi:hypothetical protein
MILFLEGCARVPLKPQIPPFSFEEIEKRLAIIDSQQGRCHTIVSTGRLLVKRRFGQSELAILMAGVKDPLRIKIEITHPWGKPVLHTLISGDDFKMVSYTDEKYYLGGLRHSSRLELLPGMMDADRIWGVIRAFPFVLAHINAASEEGGKIILTDQGNSIAQHLFYSKGSALPHLVKFSDRSVELLYSDYEETEGTLFAKKVRLENVDKKKTDLEIRFKNYLCNRQIPEAVFQLSVPSGYERVRLE